MVTTIYASGVWALVVLAFIPGLGETHCSLVVLDSPENDVSERVYAMSVVSIRTAVSSLLLSSHGKHLILSY